MTKTETERLVVVEEKIDTILENHLPHIRQEIRNLRWFILAAMGVLSIVIALIQTLT